MRLSPIVLKLRTNFAEFAIAGAAELDVAIRNTLKKDMMFVVPTAENSNGNTVDSGVDQTIEERFSVIVAIANDTTDKDKTGVLAYDRLHELRSRLFRAILGYQIIGAETLIGYKGANLWGINNAYLWYQYDFEIRTRIEQYDGYYDVSMADDESETQLRDLMQVSQLPDFNTIYAQYIKSPSEKIPWTGDIPIDTSLVDMGTMIDLTDDPDAGAFGRGFGDGFDFYHILNRR